MNPFGAELDLIRTSVGGYLAQRDVIRVFGADARSFLQGQLTQDVAGLEPGESTWSLILSPKGRVDALVRVWGGNGESEMLIDVQAGSGKCVVDRLNRYRIRTKAEVELLEWQILVLVGSNAEDLSGSLTAQMRTTPVSLDADLPGPTVVELLGPAIAVPEDLFMVSPELIDAIRIAATWPSMSNEISPLDPAPFANELGESVVALTANYDKGCYTGQEYVARVHARQVAPPRVLSRFEVPELGSDPSPGQVLRVGDSDVEVTSVGRSLATGELVVLGYVGRGVSG